MTTTEHMVLVTGTDMMHMEVTEAVPMEVRVSNIFLSPDPGA